MAKKKIDMFELKVRFNDVMMRELGLDITDDDYLYDMDTESILQIKEKYIKYFDVDYIQLKPNEIEMNLIENPRLTELLVLPFLNNVCERSNVVFQSLSQSPISGTDKGIFVMTYIKNGEVKNYKSDPYVNESVRIFNLICKLNKTCNLYKFEDFDIKIERKK